MLNDSPNNVKAFESLCNLYYKNEDLARESEYCKKALIAGSDNYAIQSIVASIYIRKEH